MSRRHNLWQDGAGWFWTSTIGEWAPVHSNPVRRGLCQTPEDWPFSRASWYDCDNGPLRLDSTEEMI